MTMQRIVPLGDQAALLYFGDDAAALSVAAGLRAERPGWVVDLVQSYATVAVYFDAAQIHFGQAAEELQALAARYGGSASAIAGKLHVIPCCYELHQDLDRVAGQTGLSVDEAIRLHTGREYTVYAIGFCPGFPYLGYLPPELSGVPRLPSPRVRVAPGSVGLTGRQTGIYTLPRPGGWNIVGRTPLQLVDVADGYFPLRTGDRVRFERIDEAEFRRLREQRL